MRSRAALVTTILTASVLALPLVAQAAVIPFFGPIIPENASACALGWGAVILVINNIISLLLTLIVVFVAPLMIAYAGFLLVASSVNPSGKERAKSLIQNLVIGFVIALAGWLIVNAIMVALTPAGGIPKPGGGTVSWFEIITSGGQSLCLNLTVQPPGATPGGGAGTGSPLLPSGPVLGSGGGVCIVRTSGPCAASGLSVFGSEANNSSMVCSAESANGTLLTSTVDKIQPSNTPVSYGLFQINITANAIGSLNCPMAFACPDGRSPCPYTRTNIRVNIVNQQLFDSCKAAALDSATNISTAYQIYQKALQGRTGNGWSPWGAARRCGLAVEKFPLLAKVCEILETV